MTRDRNSGLMVAGLILVAMMIVGVLVVVLNQPSGSSSAAEAASSPSACGAGTWLTRVIEDAAGALGLTCTSVNQEAASTPSACASHKFQTNTNESSAGTIGITCTQPVFGDLTSFPAGCAQFSFVGTIGASPTCNGFMLEVTQDRGSTNNTFHAIPGLSFTSVANTNYEIVFDLGSIQSSTNPGTLTQVAVHSLPAGATLKNWCNSLGDATGTLGYSCGTSTGAALNTCGAVSASDPCLWLGFVYITTAATTGTIALDYRRSAGTGTATIKLGSEITVSVVP